MHVDSNVYLLELVCFYYLVFVSPGDRNTFEECLSVTLRNTMCQYLLDGTCKVVHRKVWHALLDCFVMSRVGIPAWRILKLEGCLQADRAVYERCTDVNVLQIMWPHVHRSALGEFWESLQLILYPKLKNYFLSYIRIRVSYIDGVSNLEQTLTVYLGIVIKASIKTATW